MSVSDTLKTAVAEKNIADIRGALLSCLVFDMNMTDMFRESLGYVLQNGISESELFEDDKDVGSYSTEATLENYSELGGLLRINFSKKKLEELKVIGRKLYPPEEPPKTEKQPVGKQSVASKQPLAVSKKNTHSSSSAEQNSNFYAGAAAAAGCAVGAIAAAKLGAKIGGIIGFGIIGACIGGFIGYTLAKNSENSGS